MSPSLTVWPSEARFLERAQILKVSADVQKARGDAQAEVVAAYTEAAQALADVRSIDRTARQSWVEVADWLHDVGAHAEAAVLLRYLVQLPTRT